MRLFSRRPPPTTTESVASSITNRDSADGDYVLPEKPIYNIPVSSASKLKLPFRRRPHVPQSDPKQAPYSLNDVPPPRISSVMSDSGHGLPPPPRKSAIFGVYNQSVHSLPNDSSSLAHSDTPTRLSTSEVTTTTQSSSAPQQRKKSTGLFSWARERTKSRPTDPPSTVSSAPLSIPPPDPSSFNLKSFRHVRPESPTPSDHSPQRSSQPFSDSLLAPPRPRPRGNSTASDSSQRISVAAFREAHARSRANSPVPSFRPPSTAETLRVDVIGRKRASTVSVVSVADRSQPNKTPPPRPAPSAPDSSSESESSEIDDDVDSDGQPVPKPAQKRTATPRVLGSTPSTDPARTDPRALPPPTQSDQAPLARKRASVSTSALTPNAAARRASILAGTNSSSSTSQAQSRHQVRKPKDDTDESSDSSDADSEDVPLSGLVAPRRPGSSASNNSSSRPRMPPKPLIDINTLACGRPLLTPILRHENSVKNFQKKDRESDVERDQPFSVPAVLAHSTSPSPPITPSVIKQNPPSAAKPVSTHNHRSSSDIPVLPKSKAPDNDDDLINAIRLVGTLDKEQEPDTPSVKSSTDRIIPTHIRAREPPTSFTVLSRPHRQSTAETSTSPTNSNASHVSQPEPSARQRASTMVNPSPQKDKSDTVSILSVARSSRTSRIPPVPLIHSIPDSPSVKEEYKSSRPRSVSSTSVPSASQPPMLVSAMKQSKTPARGSQSSMPQRPFASNSSVAGDSPAGSSTGDSSSGRSPFTPRDGSDIGMRSKDDLSDPGSTLKARHVKKHSVTFEDQVHVRERPKTATDEHRTRERRRSEAKAALELGKIVNGRRPLNDESDEERNRNPTISVTAENGAPAPWGWQQPVATGPFPQQFGNDPAYLAAHQRALLIAKQAYQMAVAQQAMQMAGEEWERSSNTGFGSRGSVYGGTSGGSVYGGGSGGSVYGGSGGSVYGGVGGGMPMGMMGMPNMGMLMPPNSWAARSSVAFPSAASVYGVSSSQSEYGEGWGTQSVYGNSFGSSSRTSFVGSTGNNASNGHAGSRPRAWTGAGPPSSSSQPSKVPTKGAVRGRAAPPSSWKNGR